jgi:hypothetical protein
MRTARSRTSGDYLLVFVMAPSSQELEPPRYTGRFIPRKKQLTLMLDLDFDECNDPSNKAKDATQYAFIQTASERGGVLYEIETQADLLTAMPLIQQAYERATEC